MKRREQKKTEKEKKKRKEGRKKREEKTKPTISRNDVTIAGTSSVADVALSHAPHIPVDLV